MTPQALSELATGYWPAATLIAAVELRVFDALDAAPDAAPASADDVAAALGADPDRTAALLDALAAIGLLGKREAAYALPDALRPLLSRSSPACMLDALAYNADLYRQWAGLADAVRGNAPPLAGRQLGDDPAMTRRFVLGMEAKARAFGPAIAARLDVAGAETLLDVGSGPGTLTRQLAERHSGLRVTLLDLPPVLAVAKEIAAGSAACDRLAFVAADYRRDPLPAPFDVVVYAGALHQETAASAATLFARMHDALRPGGRAFMIDLMLDADRTSPPFSALFQLNMMLLRPGSRVFASGEVESLLRDAKFGEVTTDVVVGTPYRVVGGLRE